MQITALCIFTVKEEMNVKRHVFFLFSDGLNLIQGFYFPLAFKGSEFPLFKQMNGFI